MQQLIADLLTLSRVTLQPTRFEPVDLNVVLREVLSDREARIIEGGARIEADTLPTIEGDPFRMRQLPQTRSAMPSSSTLRVNRP